MRIVIATADEPLQKSLCDRLNQYEEIDVAGVAGSGAAALRLAQQYLPDVILTDLVMPLCDGIGLAEELPSLGLEKMPLVYMMLMPAQDRLKALALSKGVTGVFYKPLNLGEIARTLITASLTVKQAKGGLDWLAYVALNEIGIPRHLIGFKYLQEAVALAVADRNVLANLTSIVYPYIAEKYSSTNSRVERSMRFAVESAWNRGRVDKIEEMFGYTVKSEVGRPTNGEFIAMMAERVRVLGVDIRTA